MTAPDAAGGRYTALAWTNDKIAVDYLGGVTEAQAAQVAQGLLGEEAGDRWQVLPGRVEIWVRDWSKL